MSQDTDMRHESGACNMCSAPCSSCMHRNRALMGSKIHEFSDENCRLGECSQYSMDKGDVSSVRSRACESMQCTISETSNILSINSSHDSFSENADSKGTLSNKYEESKCADALDENSSCISRANDANVVNGSHNKNADRIGISCSSASASHLRPGGSLCAPHFEKSILAELPSSKDADADSSSPKVSLRMHLKSEADNEKDVLDPMDEAFKCSVKDERDEKSEELVQLPDMQEPPLQSLSGDETDESDTVEHDVKVCDICGDAGREDLLAICTKCSDGAEHTYCMREMLQKVPEGDWLCEDCKSAEESKNRRQDVEGKRICEVSSTTQVSGKRCAENLEIALAMKRRAVEYGTSSPKESSPKRIAALSRESSSRSFDKGKVKPGHLMSFRDNDELETPRSTTTGKRGQLTKSALMKSNSFNIFNSKPKVKLVDEVVPQKQKRDREHSFKDVKAGPGRIMGKSMSFKSAKSGSSNGTELKFNMASSKATNVQELKGFKVGKEWSASDRKNLPKVDRHVVSSTMASSIVSTPKGDQKLISRGETSMPSSVSNNRELRIAQDGKPSNFSKPSSSVARRSVDPPITSVGASSTSGYASNADQKLSHIISGEDTLPNYSLNTSDRTCNNVDGTLQDGLTRSRELPNLNEKTRDSPGFRSQPTIITAPKILHCQKCKETGHSTELCTTRGPQEFGTDVSAARSSREEMHKSSGFKAAVNRALLRRPEAYKKKGEHNVLSAEITNEGKEILDNSASGTYKSTTINDVNQCTVSPTDSHSSKLRNADSFNPSAGKAIVKDLPNEASALVPVPLKMSTIPEYEYIWQGVFDVHRGGKPAELCGGIQAHLSSCASPKVLEVANKLPQRVSLDEVSRLSTWPSQFHQNGAKEDNIALYFFAKDVESYERNYKSLLDRMIKNDLALKGCFNGIELLIFPSNQLPEEAQCWNMLFFLWGVFKGRRLNHSYSSKKFCSPILDVMTLEKDVPTAVMTLSETRCSQKRIDEGSFACDRTCNTVLVSNASAPILVMKESNLELGLDTEVKLPPEAIGSRIERTIMDSDISVKKENCVSPKILSHGNEEIGALGSVSKEKLSDRINRNRDILRLKRELQEDGELIDTDVASWQPDNKKRLLIDLSETFREEASPTCQRMFWNEVHDSLSDGESASKKLKAGFSGMSGCGSSKGIDSFNNSFKSLGNDVGSCSSVVDDKRCDEACDEKIIREDLGTTEKYFFPVDSLNLNDSQLGQNNMPSEKISSEYEDQVHDGFPNLELALGAETKPLNKGMLPFFVGVVNKKIEQDKPPDRITNEREDDDIAASLSLSLSFPSSDKGQPVKPVSKLERLLPKRNHANTSLLLFGGLSDK
ncbi:putative RING/FYVE/PHD zinc finger protein [Quillaja saponaria]|uniref:RING/FYVE/PHD zinc finger protein n=1 Tax=Quillaja saponaria TaxID=32244 RepID=A0AAD7VNS6_QUISA|nr:putative RING/FYVE/PHD zinc finger protein [Quillaja saponaria]KAJ7982628.1 putative RING/FYVE/PHD zinc finger protein [Quillaja saponaria]